MDGWMDESGGREGDGGAGGDAWQFLSTFDLAAGDGGICRFLFVMSVATVLLYEYLRFCYGRRKTPSGWMGHHPPGNQNFTGRFFASMVRRDQSTHPEVPQGASILARHVKIVSRLCTRYTPVRLTVDGAPKRSMALRIVAPGRENRKRRLQQQIHKIVRCVRPPLYWQSEQQ